MLSADSFIVIRRFSHYDCVWTSFHIALNLKVLNLCGIVPQLRHAVVKQRLSFRWRPKDFLSFRYWLSDEAIQKCTREQ